MEYTTLGGTGLKVSRICVGCLSFGHGREWFLDEDESKDLIDHAIDLGITFFDTSNMYSSGESELFLGRGLSEYDRDRYVVATKGYYGLDDAPINAKGLSRKAFDHQFDASRRRLGMETIDLYQAHAWDPDTPIEETIRAMTDRVRAGDVRYLGASKYWAHQLAAAVSASRELGVERFVSMQNFYNLVYREEERDMIPLCERNGIGILPFSPLMRGFLARPAGELEETKRGVADRDHRSRWLPESDATTEIRDRVEQLAEEKGASMAQIALSWLLHQPAVDAPIVGTTKKAHLDDAVGALDISLSSSDRDYLETPYEPVTPIGHDF